MFGTLEYYDKAAAEWAERGYAQDSELECLRDFLNMLPGGARVLDLCCGAGYESKRIVDLGYEAVGIDFSGESIKIARQKNPAISFYQEDILCDYSYIGTVDAIIVIAGLVHIETEKLPLAFEQMHKVRKKTESFLSLSEKVPVKWRTQAFVRSKEYNMTEILLRIHWKNLKMRLKDCFLINAS